MLLILHNNKKAEVSLLTQMWRDQGIAVASWDLHAGHATTTVSATPGRPSMLTLSDSSIDLSLVRAVYAFEVTKTPLESRFSAARHQKYYDAHWFEIASIVLQQLAAQNVLWLHKPFPLAPDPGSVLARTQTELPLAAQGPLHGLEADQWHSLPAVFGLSNNSSIVTAAETVDFVAQRFWAYRNSPSGLHLPLEAPPVSPQTLQKLRELTGQDVGRLVFGRCTDGTVGLVAATGFPDGSIVGPTGLCAAAFDWLTLRLQSIAGHRT